MNILLKINRKLFPYQEVFGSTDQFSPTLLVNADFTVNEIEPVGSANCTCYTVCKIASAETGKEYDPNQLWINMIQQGKASSLGATPDSAFSIGCKGLKRVPTGEIDTFPAYFRVDLGTGTAFDNVKSAIQMEYNKGCKRPVGCGTKWYSEYNNTYPNGVLPMGVNRSSDHEWQVCGWDESHPDCFKIDAHLGYYLYMPRDVFNHAMADTYGAVALTIANTSQEMIDFLKARKISLLQRALDLCYNLYKILQSKLSQQPAPVVPTPPAIPPEAPTPPVVVPPVIVPKSRIQEWASIIASLEGADKTLNNPGNFKYAPLVATWGGQKAGAGSDGGNFCKFPTYAMGFQALVNFLTLGCHDELKDYHVPSVDHPNVNPRTIKGFTLVYTNYPQPKYDYSGTLIKRLGVTDDTLISTFI